VCVAILKSLFGKIVETSACSIHIIVTAKMSNDHDFSYEKQLLVPLPPYTAATCGSSAKMKQGWRIKGGKVVKSESFPGRP
jgi:hypothetical protein